MKAAARHATSIIKKRCFEGAGSRGEESGARPAREIAGSTCHRQMADQATNASRGSKHYSLHAICHTDPIAAVNASTPTRIRYRPYLQAFLEIERLWGRILVPQAITDVNFTNFHDAGCSSFVRQHLASTANSAGRLLRRDDMVHHPT